ncbi:MAG: hypothetical protein ACK587_15645 [Cyanobacteriota bacterium]
MRPTTMIGLGNIVRRANLGNRQVRAIGSTWSFSDCWVTQDLLVDLSSLNRIFAFSKGREVWGHTDPGRGNTSTEDSVVLVETIKDEVLGSDRRFAHVEAGLVLRDLIEALDDPGKDDRAGRDRWALLTMGGASGQTLAGAISTGTHGGDFNLPPIADMVRAIHIIAPDGTPHWIERTGSSSITSLDKFVRLGRFIGALTGLLPENIHYDDDLFNATLVSVGRMGIICAYIIEVRSQFGLSERVRQTTWGQIKLHLESGSIFTGTSGINWLNEHPPTLASGSPVDKRPRGISVFINPYRINPDYDDPNPDRNVLFVTHAESANNFDAIHTRSGAGISNTALNALVIAFEAAHGLDVLRDLVNQVINGLRSSEGTDGYPVAYSVLDTTSNDKSPVLSFEMVVSTARNRHVRFIDRMLEIFDNLIRENWRRGNEIKFAGGFNLRFTSPTSALIGMQSSTASAAFEVERFCHIEVIVMKELAANPILWDPPFIHQGDHNLESVTEEWVQQFERATAEFGVKMHWGQYHQLNRARVERSYPDTLPRWRRALTQFISSGKSSTFDNSFSMRCGLEPNTEVLAATSWGAGRYDVFGFNEKGEVLQLQFASGWTWRNLGNRFENNERLVGPLTATSWSSNRIDVFGLGKRGTILQLWWAGGWNWTDLSKVMPAVFREDIKLTGPLAVTSPGADRIELFGLASGGNVWLFSYGKWGWQSRNLGNGFSGGERFVGSLTAVSDAPGRIHLFGLGKRGQVLQLWRNGDTEGDPVWKWSDFSTTFPPDRVQISGSLAASSVGRDRLDIFAQGVKGNLIRLSWNRGWTSSEVESNFPGRVRKIGMLQEFGEAPSPDDYYKYEQRNCVKDRFIGSITSVSSGGSQHVFGFGESGNILQMWRSNESEPWNWGDLDTGLMRNRQATITSLLVEIRMGGQGTDVAPHFRSDPSNVVGFVKLQGGNEITKDFSGDVEWEPFSLHSGIIELPSGTRLGDIESCGIKSLTAGPDYAVDNWDMNEVKITFLGSNVSGILLYRCGNPLWYFQKNSNQVWEVPIRIP